MRFSRHRLPSGVLLLMLAPLVPAQTAQSTLERPKAKPVSANAGLVTQKDVVTVIGKVEESFKFVLGVPISQKSTVRPANQPIDRKAVVAEFIRLRAAASPAVRLKPRDAKYDPRRLRWKSAGLEDLIRTGYLAPLGPIATKKTGTLTPAEFGDALGFFLARISEVTHQPLTRWTPYLQSPADQ
jgi:hypothetical protein